MEEIIKITASIISHFSFFIVLISALAMAGYTIKDNIFFWALMVLLVLLGWEFYSLMQRRNARQGKAPFSWKEQRVLITGGSNGLGLTLANLLVMKGADVIVLDLVPPALNQEMLHYFQCDVTDITQLEQTRQRILEKFGTGPNIIINNAGVVRPAKVLDATIKDIQLVFAVNILSYIWTCKVFLPDLVKNGDGGQGGGHLVNVASILGHSGVRLASTYTATKAAVIQFHDSLRQELAELKRENGVDIGCTLVCPGLMRTQMFEGIKYSLISRMMLPSLEPMDVAKKIAASIEEGSNREIYTPPLTYLLFVAICLPTNVRDWLQKLLKADKALEDMVHVANKKD